MQIKNGSNHRFFLGAALLACVVALGLFAPGEAQARRYASIVVDAGTGEVLHQVNADTRNIPASLTKMMTLYMAFEALDSGRLKMDQALPVSRRAAGIAPSKLGLKRGQRIRVRDAILALVTKSANDAAVVIAEALAGTEVKFAIKMTKKARALGMKRTSFRNASGLPNRRQRSTVRDMATLAQALVERYPQYYKYFSTEKFTYNGRTHTNHNSLLKNYDGTDGIKTGYTRASGFNLAASTVRSGRRLIAVVFGGRSARSRDRHIASLLDKGFATPTMTRPATVRAAPAIALPLRKPADLLGAPTPSRRPERLAAAPLPPRKPDTAATTAMDDTVAEDTSLRQVVELGIWGVQVGAFYNLSPAKRAAAKAARKFPELFEQARIVIPTIKGRRGPIYRARIVGMTEDRARTACRQLASARMDCLVVQARNALKVALN